MSIYRWTMSQHLTTVTITLLRLLARK